MTVRATDKRGTEQRWPPKTAAHGVKATQIFKARKRPPIPSKKVKATELIRDDLALSRRILCLEPDI